MSKNAERTPDGRKYRGVIYARKNKITGMSYVGKTDNEKNRKYDWNEKHNKNYGGQKIMEARKQYGIGPEAWEYDILEEIFSDTQEELKAKLKERETYWIKEKDSVENGYNQAYGDGNLGIKFSLQRRQAQSQRMKGKVPIAATIAAKEWVKKNGGGYWKNHTFSDVARANMKKAQQARGIDSIATYPDGHEELFPTMQDAAIATGQSFGSVKYSIDHNTRTRNGYKFRKA